MSDSASPNDEPSSRAWRKWVAGGLFVVFFAAILWEVINPYRGQRFEKIPHGDHAHYVPKDRNSDVPVGRFPTRKPEANERITPDGRIVPADGNESTP